MYRDGVSVAKHILDNSEPNNVFVLFKFQNIKSQSLAEKFLYIILFGLKIY